MGVNIFADIWQENRWGCAETRSGPGSTLAQAKAISDALPGVLARYGIRSMLDIPCGDCHWMSRADIGGVQYIGADVVPEIIDANRLTFPGIDFRQIDLVGGALPRVDLIFCRDCLVHLPDAEVFRALANIRASGARWFMATSFQGRGPTTDITPGAWRPLDLTASPFRLPEPAEWFDETAGDGKSMGLWSTNWR